MIKKVNFIYYSLSLLLQAIIYYILILYISFLFSKEMNYYFPLLIIPTLILVYLSRKFSKNIIILFLTHIPILLLPLIFNVDVNYKIIFLFSNIFILGFSISYWNNSKIKEIVSAPKLSVEILFILILLISNTKNFSYYLTMTLSIIYLVICYIAKYLAGMRSYIYYNAYLAEFPIHKVLKLNNTYLTGILSIGIISGIFIKVLKIDKLLYFIFGPVLKFLLGVLQYIINTIIHLINSKEIKPKKIPAVKEVAENLSENSALDNPVYASDVEGRVIRGLAPVQSLLTGILVTVGIVVGLFIIIKRMPSADDPQEKNEVYKSVGRVLGLVALGAAIVWIVPWVYGLFQ